LIFPALKRRKVQAEFSGGDITSDAGALLLHQINKRLGLLMAVDASFPIREIRDISNTAS